MRAKLLNEHPETYVLVFDKGDEFIGGLTRFATEHNLDGGHFTAIGAFQRATLAYFDRRTMEYTPIEINEQVEVLSLVGDIALTKDNTPMVHAHVVVGRSDGTTRGGHIKTAHVWPTLELVVQESPTYLRRRHDDETGLALIAV